jgi:hypothetical protein
MVRPCRCNGLPVLCEFPPHPSVDGPLIAKVQPALVVTHSVRVAPVAPDGAIWSLLTQYALLLSPRTVPGSKPAPAMDARFFHWNVAAGDQNPRNITTLYHKYLESRCVHTETHVNPSIHKEGRVKLSPLEDMYYEQQRIRGITRRITVFQSPWCDSL